MSQAKLSSLHTTVQTQSEAFASFKKFMVSSSLPSPLFSFIIISLCLLTMVTLNSLFDYHDYFCVVCFLCMCVWLWCVGYGMIGLTPESMWAAAGAGGRKSVQTQHA